MGTNNTKTIFKMNLFDSLNKVAVFQKASNQTVNTVPSLINKAEAKLRLRLMLEESGELEEGNNDLQSKIEVLDGLVDQLYIWLGNVNAHGMQSLIEPAFNLVHENNMTKVIDGRILKDAHGKVIKPEGYKRVNLNSLIIE